MKQFAFFLFAFLLTVSFSSCDDDEMAADNQGEGEFTLEFDNVIGANDDQRNFQLRSVGSDDYNLTNALGQPFNVTLLRYFISNVRLERADGSVYEDAASITPTEARGYYLIDEAVPASQFATIPNVPAGDYVSVTFTLGVDSSGVMEGAAGGVLDPATNNMFWNWNSGYVAVKIEGQSAASTGGANGETIMPDQPNGIVYHLGGWKDISGTGFVNNIQTVTLDFDSNARVSTTATPTAHLEFDVQSIFSGTGGSIDFTGNTNVHRPVDGRGAAQNAAGAFRFDHIHN
ncbi:MAG: MbnP family protein [Saprospiraceae bacterium]